MTVVARRLKCCMVMYHGVRNCINIFRYECAQVLVLNAHIPIVKEADCKYLPLFYCLCDYENRFTDVFIVLQSRKKPVIIFCEHVNIFPLINADILPESNSVCKVLVIVNTYRDRLLTHVLACCDPSELTEINLYLLNSNKVYCSIFSAARIESTKRMKFLSKLT